MADRPTDSEMLDWLEREAERCDVRISALVPSSDTPVYWVGLADSVGPDAEGYDLRSAIASAMSASSQPEPDTQ